MTQRFVSLVFAFAHHDGKKIIGDGNDLPWEHLPEDLKNFKKLTMGRAVVMGRRTWDSLPKKPLQGRQNIIISRQKNLSVPDGVAVFDDIEKSLQACNYQAGVIGGAEVFKLAYPFANVIFVTELIGQNILPHAPTAPCYLDIDYNQDFKEVERMEFQDAKYPFVIRELRPKNFAAPAVLKKLLA